MRFTNEYPLIYVQMYKGSKSLRMNGHAQENEYSGHMIVIIGKCANLKIQKVLHRIRMILFTGRVGVIIAIRTSFQFRILRNMDRNNCEFLSIQNS